VLPQSLRAKVAHEARRDAAWYFRDFQGPVATKDDQWVTEAWADLMSDFKLAPEEAEKLWPVYWKLFSQETVRRASKGARRRWGQT
jgi:hypothetical protein